MPIECEEIDMPPLSSTMDINSVIEIASNRKHIFKWVITL